MKLPCGAEVLLDAADAHLLKGWRIHLHEPPDSAGLRYVRLERGRRETRRRAYLHRVILGAPVGVLVDHRDGNGLDNRRENLRRASRQQNAANMHARALAPVSRA